MSSPNQVLDAPAIVPPKEGPQDLPPSGEPLPPSQGDPGQGSPNGDPTLPYEGGFQPPSDAGPEDAAPAEPGINDLEPIFGKQGGPEARAEGQAAAAKASDARQADLQAEAARLDEGSGQARFLRASESKQIGRRSLATTVETPAGIKGSQTPFTNPASHANPGLRYKL